MTTLLRKGNIVVKSKEVKTGWSNLQQPGKLSKGDSQKQINLTESSEDGCGSKRTVLRMMMVMNINEIYKNNLRLQFVFLCSSLPL
jgi:hypothetical protein